MNTCHEILSLYHITSTQKSSAKILVYDNLVLLLTSDKNIRELKNTSCAYACK